MNVILLLWVNLILVTLASLALATEMPSPDVLLRKPYDLNRPLISRTITINILGHSVYQLTVALLLLYFGDKLFDIDSVGQNEQFNVTPSKHFIIIFNSFVSMTLFNEINARKVHDERNVFEGFHRNIFFVLI